MLYGISIFDILYVTLTLWPCLYLMQTGMDKRLRTLVDLEALLNDGTAYTLFFVLKGFAEGVPLSVVDTVR